MISLSPHHVRKFIEAEHTFRSRFFPADRVEQIFKYGAPVGCSIDTFDAAERCMDIARQEICRAERRGDSFHSGRVFVARRLQASKGRFQRSWYAPDGGIWLTLVLVDTLLTDYANLLPIAAGVASCETARYFAVPAHLKWVNDIHVDGKKLAGILTETMIGPVAHEKYILIGIGMNVNNTVFPTELSGTAVAMRSFKDADLDTFEVTAVLLAKLAWNIGLLHYQEEADLLETSGNHKGCVAPLLQAWSSLSDTIGRKVHYGFDVVRDRQYSAEVIGITELGALIMKLPDGRQIVEAGGEIAYAE